MYEIINSTEHDNPKAFVKAERERNTDQRNELKEGTEVKKMATATLRVKGSIAPDGKDVQPVVYDVDFEVSLPMRDLFAAFALAGLVSCGFNPDEIASRAFDYADAALAAAQEQS